ncbi:MAG: DUF3313 domain-containing protein [Planctomycetota bacterium]|jgi:hypothetical protein
MLNRFFMLLILISAIMFSGCAAQQLTSYETSGFLGSYANFKPGDKDQPNLVYLNPGRDLRQYNKVLIDHVIIYFNPESENRGVDPAQLNELTQYFHQALVNALKDRYPIVDRPGQGVLRIRTAITDVEPGSPVAGAATTIVPVGATVSVIKKATTGSNMAVGRASMEIELLDSLSGVRLAAAIDRREGGKKVVSGKWTAIQEAFEYWAQKLRVWLDKERAK